MYVVRHLGADPTVDVTIRTQRAINAAAAKLALPAAPAGGHFVQANFDLAVKVAQAVRPLAQAKAIKLHPDTLDVIDALVAGKLTFAKLDAILDEDVTEIAAVFTDIAQALPSPTWWTRLKARPVAVAGIGIGLGLLFLGGARLLRRAV
jgi:hypothetical protein